MPAMDYDGGQRVPVEVMKAAQQASSAAGVGEEIAAFCRALGLAVSALACGRPPAAMMGRPGMRKGCPFAGVAVGHSPLSAIGRPARLFNPVTFGIAHAFGVLPGGVLQYPGSSEVAR